MEFVFARGSGQSQDTGESFLEFQKNMALAAKQAKLSYRITDLNYEAVAISVGNALGTYVSAGEAYSFGKSINGGVGQLEYYMRSRASCANTYWVLAGYSQGAMVVANSLKSFDADKVVYVALFGDPKLYLPEGEGFNPPACRGENLSEYRVYVPNCDTDNGILGARKPYELESLAGRYGLWCNDNDFICGSSKNPLNSKGHSQYEENGAYYTAAMQVLKRLEYLRKNYSLLRGGLVTKNQTDEIAAVVAGRTYEDEPVLPSLNISAQRCGEEQVCLSWTRTRGSGRYLALRINDYFIGFVDVTNEGLTIGDVDFSDIEIAMGSADAGYNMGEMAELKIEGVAESVPTSASLPWWRILVIALLPVGILGLVRAIVRLVSDIMRMK